MAGYSDYYSIVSRAISDLPGKTEEARGTVYDLARTALQKSLSALDPPISDTDVAIERFALEAAIQRVEMESRSSYTRHDLSSISKLIQIVHSAGDKLNNHFAIIKGDSLKAAIGAVLVQGLEFIQKTRLTATSQRFFNFGDQQGIAKYPKIRIAVRLLLAAVLGIFGGTFVYWMTTENNSEAKSHSLISPSELALSDITLRYPDSDSAGGWEVKGTMKNNSLRTVAGFWLKVTIRDCDTDCVTIGEEIKRIVVNIPPSQTRIVDEGDLFSSKMFIPKKVEWSYEIVQTDAK
jgi:hypothetical protein